MKAAVLAAMEGGEMIVTGAHLEAALAELDEGGRLARKLLGFRPAEEEGATATGAFAPSPAHTGFPMNIHSTR